MFDIRFELSQDANSEEVAVGTIVLGSFRETFESPLHVWSREDYESHWSQSLERLFEGAGSTVLITEMYEPTTANFIKWWPAYRFGAEVRFHNQLLILAGMQPPFDLDDLFGQLPPYEQTNEDGDRLSEWSIGIDALREFLQLRDAGD